jgi:prephenate dehydratase
VEQLALIGRQAGLDVAQRLSPCELRERHHAKQVGAAERAHAGIAVVPLDDSTEGLPRHELHHLREQRLAHVHATPQVVQTREHRKPAIRNSNRGHP